MKSCEHYYTCCNMFSAKLQCATLRSFFCNVATCIYLLIWISNRSVVNLFAENEFKSQVRFDDNKKLFIIGNYYTILSSFIVSFNNYVKCLFVFFLFFFKLWWPKNKQRQISHWALWKFISNILKIAVRVNPISAVNKKDEAKKSVKFNKEFW